MGVVVDIVVNVETDGGPDRGVVVGFNTEGEVVFISVKEIMIRSSHVHCKSTPQLFFLLYCRKTVPNRCLPFSMHASMSTSLTETTA